MSNTLVVYFSASGETARLARTIAQAARADLCELRPAQPYTAADLNWHDPASRSSVEMKDPACRPAIAGEAPDLTDYDTVFSSLRDRGTMGDISSPRPLLRLTLIARFYLRIVSNDGYSAV